MSISQNNLNLFQTIQAMGDEFALAMHGLPLNYDPITYNQPISRVENSSAITSLQGFLSTQQSGWQLLKTDFKSTGLDVAVFKNGNSIVIFAAGNDQDGTTDGMTDVHFSGTPLASDIVPVTAFQLVDLYKDLELENPDTSITLSGHSIGGSVALTAGAILQAENSHYKDTVKVVAYNPIEDEHLLDNLGITTSQLNVDNIYTFHNSLDMRTMPSNWDGYGKVFYTNPSQISANSNLASYFEAYQSYSALRSVIELLGTGADALIEDVYNYEHALKNLDLSTYSQVPTYRTTSQENFYTNVIQDAISANQALIAQQDHPDILLGVEPVTGGSGDDVLVGKDLFVQTEQVGYSYNQSQSNDSILGLAGNDILFGDKGNDTLDGGVGDDTYYGSLGNDTFIVKAAEGKDVIINTFGSNDTLKLQSSSSIILDAKNVVKNLIRINTSDMLIYLDKKNNPDNTVLIENQFDTTNSGIENFYVDNKKIDLGTKLADNIDLSTGTIAGGAAGFDGNDSLKGSLDDDYLGGGEGNDTLIGNTGNDTLLGGNGDDIYVFNVGDGNDTVDDGPDDLFEEDGITPLDGGDDTLQFGTGINRSDLILTEDSGSNALLVTFKNSSDNILIQDELNPYGSAGRIEHFAFSDGSTSDITVGSLTDDSLTSPSSAYIFGLDGNDSLTGSSSADYLSGGEGNDTLEGNGGNDTLNGGLGDDTYLFHVGDGIETILDAAGDDILQFGDAITRQDVIQSVVGQDLILKLKNSSNQILIKGEYPSNAHANPIETIKYSDNSTITSTSGNNGSIGTLIFPGNVYFPIGFRNIMFALDDINISNGSYKSYIANTVTVQAADVNVQGYYDTNSKPNASVEAEHFDLTGGNDLISDATSAAGDFDVSAYVGYSWVEGTAEEDPAIVTADSTTIGGKYIGGNDTMMGAITGSTLIGDGAVNFLSTGASVEIDPEQLPLATLDYQGGDDLLIGNESHDRLIGDGNISTDIVRASDVSVVYGDDTLFGDGGDDTLVGDGSFNRYQLQSSTAITWGNDSLVGGDGNDILTGDGSSEDFTGLFDITYYVQSGDIGGNDTLDGGAGNDTLYGSIGDDIYIFNRSYGQDLIVEGFPVVGADGTLPDTHPYSANGGTDTVRFGAAINSNDLIYSSNVTSDGVDLVISIQNSSDKLTIKNQLSDNKGHSDPGHRVENFEFIDGTVLSYQDIANMFGSSAAVVNGTSGGDYLHGTGINQYISGLDGNDNIKGSSLGDTLDGGVGNDTINAGTGHDTLVGGIGDDLFVIDSSDVTIQENANEGNDTLYIDQNLTDISVQLNGSDMVISSASGIIATITNELMPSGALAVESFSFASGETLSALQLLPAPPSIVGTSGDDHLTGTPLSELIQGLEGNDTLSGAGGNDTLDGGDGNDLYQLSGHWGQNTIIDSSGEDTVSVSTTNDLYINLYRQGYQIGDYNTFSFAGWDSTSTRIEAIIAGGGNDTINGDDTNNLLNGGGGNDIFDGGSGADTLVGGTGNDLYYVTYGNNTIVENSNEGNDTLSLNIATSSSDFVFKNNGNNLDILFNNQLFARVENQFASDGFKVENFAFNNGSVLSASAIQSLLTSTVPTNQTIIGTSGDDTLTGGDGNDTLIGLAGNDSLSGGNGDDTYQFSSGFGQDTVNELGQTGNDTLQFTDLGSGTAIFTADNAGDLTVSFQNSSDQVQIINALTAGQVENFQFSDNSLTLAQAMSQLQVQGTTGNDNLSGSSYTESIFGYAGDDTLNGSGGLDSLIGGTGDDQYFTVDAGATIIENANEGTDTAYVNHLQSDFTFSLAGNDFVASYGGADWLTSKDQVTGNGLDYLHFSDGSTVSVADIIAGLTPPPPTDLTLNGTSGDDTLVGGDGNDTLNGNAGNDSLSGGNGNDRLDTGEGDDFAYGDSGNDTLIGYNGNDSLYGADGDDSISGDNGNDFLYGGNGNDSLDGGDGADLMTGDSGDDTLYGRAGNDSLLGGAGADLLDGGEDDDSLDGSDGNDTLIGYSGNDILYGVAGNDSLQGGDGNDSLFGGDGDDSLDGGNGDDALNGDTGNDTLYGRAGNDTLSGGDGNDIVDGGEDNDVLLGNSGDDTLVGYTGNDFLSGDDGNDVLNGGDGDDTLEGGNGNDSLIGEAGNDTLYGRSGADTLSGGDGDDLVDAGEDNDLLYGNNGADTLTGYSGNDTLYGGNGNDSLEGGDGDDFLSGDSGDDTLYGRTGNDTLNGGIGNDSLNGGEDADVLYGGDGNDTLDGYSGNDTLFAGDGNDSLEGGDGDDSLNGDAGNDTIMGRVGNDTLSGGEGDDLLDAGEDNDSLMGGSGDDNLIAYSGDDTLAGGTGNDVLNGGDGNDTYLFSQGDGMDSIFDNAGTDTLSFDNSVLQSAVALFRDSNNHLEIGFTNSSGDQIILDNANDIEQIQLSGGNYLTNADVNLVIQSMSNYATNNSVSMTSLSDVENNANLMAIINGAWHAA